MKTILKISVVLSLFLISCTSLQQTANNDDLYYSPNDKQKTNYQSVADNKENLNDKQYVNNEELDKKITALLNDESQQEIDTTIYQNEDSGNPYQDIVVHSYDEAYQKRLEARKSGYYGITNNYFVMTSDDYWYASAYLNDPFYNVIIVGDQVWVEPSWITSSFGYWGYSSRIYPYYGYYGWSSYYDYYYPYYYSYHSPWYYRPYYYPYYTINNYYYDNNNWSGSSSLHSYRRRGLTTASPDFNYRTERSSRNLPETYIGNDIRRTRTIKDGLDENSTKTTRSEIVRERRDNNTEFTSRRATRVTGGDDSQNNRNTRNSDQEVTRKRTGSESSGTDKTYTRTTRQNTSTYDASKRTNSTRYTRPEKQGESGNRSGSTYSTGRSGSSSRSSGSTYTPARSSGNSSGNVRSSGSSRSNSGSSRSSGSSNNSGSSGSSRSSGSERGGRR